MAQEQGMNPSAESLLNEDVTSSPLALLGTRGASDDLLDEALKGRLDAPTSHPVFKPVKGFGGLQEEFKMAIRKEAAESEVPSKDLEEIPAEVKRDIEFHFVSHMDEVLGIALARPLKPLKSGQKIDEETLTQQPVAYAPQPYKVD